MGVDLSLLVPIGNTLNGWKDSLPCFDTLRFDRDYRVFGQIANFKSYGEPVPTIETQELPSGMTVMAYNNDGVVEITVDAYGAPLRYAFARDMKKLRLPDAAFAKNRAIKAFIDAMPNNSVFVLYWC